MKKVFTQSSLSTATGIIGKKVGLDIGRFIIGAGFDVRNCDLEFKVAVEIGNLELIRMFVDNGFDLTTMPEGRESIITATKLGHLDVVEYLVEKGVNVDYQDEYGRTALMFSVFDFSLLKQFAGINKESTIQKAVSLSSHLELSQKDRSRIAKYLIDKGADINLKNNAGWSAYNIAKYSKNLKAIKILLENGANTDEPKKLYLELVYASTQFIFDTDVYRKLKVFHMLGIRVLTSKNFKLIFTKEHLDGIIAELKALANFIKYKIFRFEKKSLANLNQISRDIDILNQISDTKGISFYFINIIRDGASYETIEKILIKNNINLNLTDIDGKTALYYALVS